nr:uncharacterized protein LOC124498365 [Dermatophagoides farinae]
MGCGASSSLSNTQIVPINATETTVGTNSENARQQQQNWSTKSWIHKNGNNNNNNNNGGGGGGGDVNHQQQNRSRIINGFTLRILLPCRFVGNSSSNMDINGTMYNANVTHSEVQTDSDTIGFKCQYSQTELINMNDEEFDAMIQALDEQFLNESTNKINTNDQIIDNDNSHKTFNSLQEQQNFTKRLFINVAVQATKKKSTRSTQTKFGSIDHCFLPELTLPSNQHELLRISENLTKAIVDCKSNSNDNDQMVHQLLSSLDDDDDEFDSNIVKPDEIVEKVKKTLSKFDNGQQKTANNSSSIINPTIVRKIPSETLWRSKSKGLMKQQKVQDCIFLLLDDIRKKKSLDQLLPNTNNVVVAAVQKRDVSLQTTNDILTDESPEYAARSPLCHKNEMIPSSLMFRDIDEKMLDAPDFVRTQDIAQYVCKFAKNDLFKIRALFTWITRNIRFNSETIEKNLISTEILEQKQGKSKDYCRLFDDVCRLMGVRVKKIDGFVRDYHYRPGYHFQPGKDAISSWNAAFVLSSWRFIDLTLAAGYADASGEFHAKTNEHYFLTDPAVLIWTHFPYSDVEENYERWQLLDKPIKLDEFNAQPKVMEHFFEYNLSIRSRIHNPLEFRISTEVKIGSHEAMRYKYKLYAADEQENSSLNYYVFCQLKEDRLVGSFMVQPPLAGRFILKIFAKPEREMQGSQQDLSQPLDPIIMILLECTKARKYIEPFPLNELPWGLTQKFYDYKLKMVNQKGPIIVTWGGRRRLVMESIETMLITYSLYDSDSLEMDTRNIIIREDNGFKTIFTINPPRVGTFKFILFGMPKPKQKGKWRLPMLATLMIDCKLIKPLQHDEDMTVAQTTTHTTNDDNNNNKNDKKSKSKK